LQFKPDVEGLESGASLRYRIVSGEGKTIVEGPLGAAPAIIQCQALEAGKYWLRVLDAQGQETLREFSISVR
jgi:hypothetical protein